LWEEFAQQTKREMCRKEEANLQNDKKKKRKKRKNSINKE